MTAKCLVEVCVSIGDVNCSTMCARSVATEQHETDAASAATCWTQKVEDTDPGPAHENGEFADNEVASHPLIANLSQEICGHNSRQGQESCMMKHFRLCGEFAAGVRQPRRPRHSRLRSEETCHVQSSRKPRIAW